MPFDISQPYSVVGIPVAEYEYFSQAGQLYHTYSPYGTASLPTYTAPSVGGGAAISAGTNSINSGTVNFSNSNGVTFGMNPTGVVTASVAGAGAGAAISAAGSSQNGGTVVFSNSNNVSFGMNGSTVTASASAQSVQSLGIYASSQTTGASSSSTHDARSLSIVGAGAISVGWTNGSLIISDPGTTALPQISVGFSTQGNTSGNTGLVTGQVVFVGTNGVTLSGSTNAGSMTVTVSAPATSSLSATGMVSISSNGGTISIGGGTGTTTGTGTALGITLSNNGISLIQPAFTRVFYPDHHMSQVSAFGNASASFQYMAAQDQLSASRVDAYFAWSASSTASAVTMAIALSAYAAIYTKNGATLSSLSSGSTQTTYSYASNSAGQTQLITNAIRPVSVPVNINMAPGEYFVGFNLVTAASSVGAATTNLAQTLSVMGQAADMQSALNYAEFTNQTNATTNLYGGMGLYSAATTGLPAAVSLSAINQTGAPFSQANIVLGFRNG